MTGLWSQVRLFREAKLDDNVQCLRWCMQVGLLRQQHECRTHRRACTLVEVNGGLHWRCTKCRNRKSVMVGTLFEDSHLEPGKILMLGYCYANLSTYDEAQRACVFSGEDTDVARDTVAHWFDIFRDRIIDAAPAALEAEGPIGGPGIIVQVDEALIGRRKYNRGRIVTGTWVLGMIDASGHVRMEICERRDADTLTEIIQRNVHTGSIIHTDGWPAYRRLSELGYTHQWVNHSLEFVAEDGTHTQRIESQWRALRRRFSPGGIRHESIGDHLIEYMWRRKCKQDGRDTFSELVKLLKLE